MGEILPRWLRQLRREPLPLEEIRKLPLDELTTEEISLLPYEEWRAKVDERRAREAACEKHEAVSTGSREEATRGWHPAHCKHCGKDMSRDSGD
jgi:hypothetical protein